MTQDDGVYYLKLKIGNARDFVLHYTNLYTEIIFDTSFPAGESLQRMAIAERLHVYRAFNLSYLVHTDNLFHVFVI